MSKRKSFWKNKYQEDVLANPKTKAELRFQKMSQEDMDISTPTPQPSPPPRKPAEVDAQGREIIYTTGPYVPKKLKPGETAKKRIIVIGQPKLQDLLLEGEKMDVPNEEVIFPDGDEIETSGWERFINSVKQIAPKPQSKIFKPIPLASVTPTSSPAPTTGPEVSDQQEPDFFDRIINFLPKPGAK